MIQRYAPLPARRKPIARTPIKRRRMGRVARDRRGSRAFQTWLHAEACAARWLGPYCAGSIEAAHCGPAGSKGTGLKSPSDTQVPLCLYHHVCLDERRGVFARWSREAVAEWKEQAVEATQAAWAQRNGGG